MMDRLQQFYSKKTPQNLSRFSGVVRALRPHLFRSVIIVSIGLMFAAFTVLFLDMQGLFLLGIAIPPAMLCGASWVQSLRKHSYWLENVASLRTLLRMTRKYEPVLFWLGMVGSYVVCLAAYFVAFVPSDIALLDWVKNIDFYIEITSLAIMVTGFAELSEALYLQRRLRNLPSEQRTSVQLVKLFLEEYEQHKN